MEGNGGGHGKHGYQKGSSYYLGGCDEADLDGHLGKYMRRGADLETYYQVRGWRDEYEFKKGTVFHQREADINQEIYRLPEWLPELQSALLNESVRCSAASTTTAATPVSSCT